jgi:hypothetical protein
MRLIDRAIENGDTDTGIAKGFHPEIFKPRNLGNINTRDSLSWVVRWRHGFNTQDFSVISFILKV